jgi:hypothetical protein
MGFSPYVSASNKDGLQPLRGLFRRRDEMKSVPSRLNTLAEKLLLRVESDLSG